MGLSLVCSTSIVGRNGPVSRIVVALVCILVSSFCMGTVTSYDPAFAVPSSKALSGASTRVGRFVAPTVTTAIGSDSELWKGARLVVNAAEAMILKAFPIPTDAVGFEIPPASLVLQETVGQSRHGLTELFFSTTALVPPSTGSIRPMQQQQQQQQLGPLTPEAGKPPVGIAPTRRESLVAPRGSSAASNVIDNSRLMPESGRRLLQATPGATYKPPSPIRGDDQSPLLVTPASGDIKSAELTADQLAANLRVLDVMKKAPTAAVLYALFDFFVVRKNQADFVQDVQEDMDEAGQIANFILDVGERIRNVTILVIALFVISFVTFDPYQ